MYAPQPTDSLFGDPRPALLLTGPFCAAAPTDDPPRTSAGLDWARSARQAAQDLQVGGVGAPAVQAGDLEDERHGRQPRVVQERPKALLADLAAADVGVPVAVGAQPRLRVVAVDDLELLQADHARPFVQRRPGRLRRPLVVAGRERVAGVEADADAGIAGGVEHGPQLLEPRADAAAHPGVVLDQEPGRGGVGALHDPLQVADDRGQALLEAHPLVAAGVEDHAADAQPVRRRQVAGQRALGPLAEEWVVAGEVEPVDRVEADRPPAGRAAGASAPR